MTERSVSLRRIRLAGRAPRHAFVAACLAVAVGELVRVTDEPQVRPKITSATHEERPADAEGLAQLFTRQFLDEGEDQDTATASLSAMGLPEDAVTSVRPGSPGAGRVSATAVVASEPAGPGKRAVTVSATRAGSTTFLRVVVTRDRRGRLSVQQPPSIVQGPSTARTVVRPAEVEVDDRPLRAATTRVVRHYLAGEADELSADLAAGAVVRPPATSFRLASVLATTWVTPSRRVATEVLVRAPRGQQLTLRYELSVVRVSGRWLVTGVDKPTPDREVTP